MSGFCDQLELEFILKNDFEVVIHNIEQIDLIKEIPKDKISNLKAWFKIDTGMHRLGFLPDEIDLAYRSLDNAIGVKNINIMTHFACADDAASSHMLEQISLFDKACAKISLSNKIV